MHIQPSKLAIPLNHSFLLPLLSLMAVISRSHSRKLKILIITGLGGRSSSGIGTGAQRTCCSRVRSSPIPTTSAIMLPSFRPPAFPLVQSAADCVVYLCQLHPLLLDMTTQNNNICALFIHQPVIIPVGYVQQRGCNIRHVSSQQNQLGGQTDVDGPLRQKLEIICLFFNPDDPALDLSLNLRALFCVIPPILSIPLLDIIFILRVTSGPLFIMLMIVHVPPYNPFSSQSSSSPLFLIFLLSTSFLILLVLSFVVGFHGFIGPKSILVSIWSQMVGKILQHILLNSIYVVKRYNKI